MASGEDKKLPVWLDTLRKRCINVWTLFRVIGRYFMYRDNEIDPKKVFFVTYDHQFTCNPRYIAEELLRRGEGLDLVFVTPYKDKKLFQPVPEGIRTVAYSTPQMYREMATARVWVDNALNCVWHFMPKKKSQILINTWHGSLGIKRLSGNFAWRIRAGRMNRVTDYCISDSTFEEDVYRSTFWPDVPYLRFGHARNDLLFSPDRREAARKKAFDYFDIPDGVKLVLYAPTFRDNGDESCYNIDFDELVKDLSRRFGGSWRVLFRYHFKYRGHIHDEPVPRVIDATRYPEMQELMAAADAGITDYSSWAFDYMLMRRPLFIYATDIEKYNTERGFYYPLETTPFPISTDNAQLKDNVLNFNSDKYLAGVEKFLDEKGCMEDGHAAQRVADFILSKIKE